VTGQANERSKAAGLVPVGLLGAAGFIVTADARVINPLLDIIAREFKSDIGSTGFIVTAYTIPYGLFQLVYGPLGDKLGKLKIMTVAMALFAVGTAICAFAPDLLILNLLRFLTGVAAAAMIPMSLAYIGDNFPYQERQAAIGQFVGAVALGNILSTSMGGIVGDFLNWRLIFLLYGLVSLGIFWLLWQASRKATPPPLNPQRAEGLRAYFRPYAQLLTKLSTRIVIIAVFIEGVFFFGGFAYLGAFLRHKYDLAYVVIGFMLSGFGIGSLIYSRSVRWLVGKFGESGLIRVGGWICFGSYLVIALLEYWPLFIPMCIILGLSYYMLHSTLQTKATEMSPGARGTAVSLFAFSLFLGQGIGAALIGLVVDGPGYEAAFIISGAGMAGLAVWFVRESRRFPPSSSQAETSLVKANEAQSSVAISE